jgi:hypothetical protein
MHGLIVLQLGDLVLQLQLTSLQSGDLKLVEAGMGLSLFDFPLQRLMTPLELCKMRFDGHSRLHVGLETVAICHKSGSLSNGSAADLAVR